VKLRSVLTLFLVSIVVLATGCEWRGINSMTLPGTAGDGDGSFTIRVQLPDAVNIEPNSRVRVNDVTVGNVMKIEREGWHALLTLRLEKGVTLPANATASLGQTSLLGSLHLELAPPKDVAPEGRLTDGALIPLASAKNYPSTEQTLSAVSMLLNGGGIGNLQDITQSLSSAFTGREQDLRNLVIRLNDFIGYLNDQTGDIIAATESLNNLAGEFAAKKPVLDEALRTLPRALGVLKDQRGNLTEMLTRLGQFSALTSDTIDRSKDSLVTELTQLGPILKSLADAGPDLTRSLSSLATYPWPNETLEKWVRGDYANLTGVIDLTLSRIDSALFTGTRFEGKLTELEMQWGRTIGQLPSPYTAGNPLVVPYRWDQGP
jgi:phospholipid/cholesterol/gamma-HCH transport system substrate-binding protein